MRYLVCFLFVLFSVPMASADGVSAGLADAQVTPILRAAQGAQGAQGATEIAQRGFIPEVLPGSNQVGRPGLPPDRVSGYNVNIAYDHVTVGAIIMGGLYLMTRWMAR